MTLPGMVERWEQEIAQILGCQPRTVAAQTGEPRFWLGLLVQCGGHWCPSEPTWPEYQRRGIDWPGQRGQTQVCDWHTPTEGDLGTFVGTVVYTDEYGGDCILIRLYPEKLHIDNGDCVSIKMVTPEVTE